MLEPVARNTAPAIAAAALLIEREDPHGVLAVMPSDHVIKDERRIRRRRAPGRRSRRGRQAGAVRHRARRARTPATATSAAARRWRASTAPLRSSAFTEKPDGKRPRAIWRPATTTGTAAFSCWARAHFCDELERLDAVRARGGEGRAGREPREDLGFLRLDAAGIRASSPSISVDYAVMERTNVGRGAADRRRLERCRLMVIAVGAQRAGRARQRRAAATPCSRPPKTPTSTPSGRWSRPSASRISSSSTRQTRCWWRTRRGRRT